MCNFTICTQQDSVFLLTSGTATQGITLQLQQGWDIVAKMFFVFFLTIFTETIIQIMIITSQLMKMLLNEC